VSAEYFLGNGALLTGIEQYVLPSEITADVLGNVTATGNVSAEYFLGNGALLTGIVSTVPQDLDVTDMYASNAITTSNVFVTDAVTANVFVGDGSLLSGIVTLDQDGKIPQNELNGYLVVPQGYVANTAVRLALGGGDLPVGSLARQVDTGNSYLLTETPSNVDSNWIVFDGLNFPVNTVFGRVGDILSTFGDYTDDYIELTSNVGPIAAGNSVHAALQYLMGQITAIQAFISTPAAPFGG